MQVREPNTRLCGSSYHSRRGSISGTDSCQEARGARSFRDLLSFPQLWQVAVWQLAAQPGGPSSHIRALSEPPGSRAQTLNETKMTPDDCISHQFKQLGVRTNRTTGCVVAAEESAPEPRQRHRPGCGKVLQSPWSPHRWAKMRVSFGSECPEGQGSGRREGTWSSSAEPLGVHGSTG